MTIGIRIRDENTNALRMEITDFTVSNTYTENIYLSSGARNGSRTIAGISSTTHIAFFVPCFDIGVFGPITYYNEPRMPTTYISGNTVYWVASHNSDYWTDGYYTLRVVRIQ